MLAGKQHSIETKWWSLFGALNNQTLSDDWAIGRFLGSSSLRVSKPGRLGCFLKLYLWVGDRSSSDLNKHCVLILILMMMMMMM